MPQNTYYPDYLQLEAILNAQQPISFLAPNEPAHDEMLFIIIHQAYELWFKQILFEVESVSEIMGRPLLNDNSPELQTVTHRLLRVNTILKLLVQQMDVMETMTPLDFLDFRDLLRPASGFQSMQFKLLEAKLGLPFESRHGQQYYLSALKPADAEKIKKAELEPGILQLLNTWLERMPYFEDATLWQHFEAGATANEIPVQDVFWHVYRNRLAESLSENEKDNLKRFDETFGWLNNTTTENPIPRQLSAAASRSALFIMLYRGFPLLQLPFNLLNALLETDECLSTWRYRHMNMVNRMIGHRIGTGGSTGKNYLKGAADQHYIFSALSGLTSFLIERKKLPELSSEMQTKLGFAH